ncbi:MAG: methylmalonyl Co-A mutase-associated GTPase MeaB [Saprospiraceae bacterium]|nr:methylmalonyl Co-A mutase-associated GTPase MeaB [Saprospiraceae bacterium]
MAKGINPNLKLKSRALKTLEQYLDGLQKGDRFILGEVLTLIESTNKRHRSLGEQILNAIDSSKLNTIRVGITGSPGAGKSTFIETLGKHYIKNGKKVAVLAIDPSSTKSQGSILGDKTRMQSLSTNSNAFVRPTASANRLGGVAQSTKESISLCEAAGYDIILVESVGVGQSETELADLVDIYLLLLLPGGGDGVQGIKRGVVELADMMVVNKYDGEYKHLAEKSRKDFALSSSLFHHDLQEWRVPVELCSSTEDKGFESIIKKIEGFISLSKSHSFFSSKRGNQDQKWLGKQIKKVLIHKANQLFDVRSHLQEGMQDSSIFQTLQNIHKAIEKDFNTFMSQKKKENG